MKQELWKYLILEWQGMAEYYVLLGDVHIIKCGYNLHQW
jgi:hypothetical protein